ncbi:hypothetical protein ACV35V_32920, partial [Pseudomonas aeruginosa]
LCAWQLFERVAPAAARLEFVSVEKSPLAAADLRRALALWPELAPWSEALLGQYLAVHPGFKRQRGRGREVADVGGGGEDREWRAGQAFVAGVGAPVVALAAQAYCPAAQQGDPGGGGLFYPEAGWVHPPALCQA